MLYDDEQAMQEDPACRGSSEESRLPIFICPALTEAYAQRRDLQQQ